MNLFHVGLPTKDQWKKVAKAAAFSFTGAFLAAFTAAGGLQTTHEATVSLALSSLTSAFNVTLYALYITLFDSSEK